MPARKLKEFLDREGVRYVTIAHSPAYTAPEIAHSVHVPGRVLAKTVMVKLDGRMAMAVLPSSCSVDFESLRRLTGAKDVKLADEQEFSEQFPGCDVGAMPPFGNLYGMPVFVSDELAENDQIVFNAGTHTEVVKLAYRDYDRLVRPKILHFATQAV